MRDSCIEHRARQPIAIVREDYYLLMSRDCVASALLNVFEYWANSAIANNPDVIDPWVGERTIKEFETLLLGISTDKQIRNRLHTLQDRGFIETRQPCAHRKTLEYRFMINAVQNALDELKANGQTTAGSNESQRSNDRRVNGQTTAGSNESQRSNDRSTIYKKDHDQEEFKEEDSSAPQKTIAVVVETIQGKSALKQIETLPDNPKNSESNPDIARAASALEQTLISGVSPENINLASRLVEIDSFLELVLPANENNNQPQPAPLSQQERETLKQAQIYAFNPAIAPWRDAATIINPKVQKAIFDANPKWYSTGSGSVNIKKINDRIKSLERQMRGTGAQAVEAYVELMNYVTMSQVPNSAEIIKQTSGDAKQQATTSNLMSMLSDRLSQKGVQP